MFKSILLNLRYSLRKNTFLATFYRRFFTNLPIGLDNPESLIKDLQTKKLLNIKNKDNDILFLLVLECRDENVFDWETTLDSLIMQTHKNWLLLVPNLGFESLSEYDMRVINSINSIPRTNIFVGSIYLGDCLHIDALSAFSTKTKKSDLIYCDHDLLVNNKRAYPQYKPDWNCELAYSTFYTGNLTLYRLDRFTDIQYWLNFDSHYQRVIYLIGQDFLQVEHLPLTLYHQCENVTSYTSSTDLFFLKQHLKKMGATATTGMINGSYKIIWPIPETLPLVSIIIPTKNGKELVEQCIESLYVRTTYKNFEVILVDNQSDNLDAINYFHKLVEENKVKLVNYDKPFNYSAINNFAVKNTRGKLLVLMNNDIKIISPDWLTEMVRQLLRPSIGCVGAKLYYPNETIQHAGVILGLGRCAGHSHKHFSRDENGYMNRLKLVQNYSAVTAACLGIRKDVYNKVGGLNEADLKVAFNDVDLCLKVSEAGYKNLWSPYIEMYHYESVSRGDDFSVEHRQRFMSEVLYMQQKWKLDNFIDPFYSPWLSITNEDFSYNNPVYFYIMHEKKI